MTRERRSSLTLLWVFLVLLEIAVVFSAKPFPWEDGPIHLYYVQVLRSIFEHHGWLASFFTLKQLPSPYLFHYSSLYLLESLFDPITAEQVLVSIYICWFHFGVYYLARSLGPNWIYACLICLPLALNLELYLGFLNFTFGVATVLIVIGYLIRRGDGWTRRSALTFLALFLVLISMHPVPVLLLAGFLLLDYALRFVKAMTEGVGGLRAGLAAIGSAWLPGIALALWAGWVLVLTRIYRPTSFATYQTPLRDRVMGGLFLFAVSPLESRSFRYPLLLLWGLAMALVARYLLVEWQSIRAKQGFVALFIVAVACVFAYCFLPENAAGSGLFSIRFLLFAIILLLSLIAASQLSRGARAAISLVATIVLINSCWHLFRMQKVVAAQIRPLLEEPIAIRGQGAMIATSDMKKCPPCDFNPYEYAAAHYFRRSGSVFLNSIWSTLPVIPLSVRNPHSWDDEMPREMLKTLVERPPTMTVPDFLIVSQDGAAAVPLPADLNSLFQLCPGALGSDRYALYGRKER